MSDEYTPTTEQVREGWVRNVLGYSNAPERVADETRAEFDRWLSAERARWQAEALREFAAKARARWAPFSCPWVGAVDDEAARIETEEKSNE